MSEDPPSTPRRPDRAASDGVVLVLCGGDEPHPALTLPPVDVVIAADSGAEQAARLGVRVDAVVGDLDSIRPVTLADIDSAGGLVERHHRDKDATDIELSLAAALLHQPHLLLVVGGHGGRLDHALATMGALAAAAGHVARVEAWMGPAQVLLTTGEVRFDARVGELVSLIPLLGAVDGVTTSGLRWPLDGATLAAGATRGVSNEVTDPPAHVTLDAGTLAVVRPHALDPAADVRLDVPDRPVRGRAP